MFMAVRANAGRWRSETRLRLIDDFHVHVRNGGNTVELRAGGQVTLAARSGLAILDAFQKPRTMIEALEALKPGMASSQAWVDAASCIEHLFRAGFLIDAEAPALAGGRGDGYGAVTAYVGMLEDRRRTESFLAGVKAIVRPGDVVLDLGTGIGLLAIAAAQAGASRVYALEPTGIGTLAEANFHANGYGDRITLITGMSTDVELPERADVLLSDLVSNDPLGERVVQITADARRRLLKPAARLMPSGVRIFALPVAVPETLLPREPVTPTRLDTWRQRYGIDFAALAENAPPPPPSSTVNPWRLAGRAIGTSVKVFETELATAAVDDIAIQADGAFEATEAARLNGVLIYWEAEFGPGRWFSTHPDHVEQDNMWRRLRVWLLPEPFMLEPGQRYQLTYRHQSPGHEDGVQVRR